MDRTRLDFGQVRAESLEDIARGYLEELINRNLAQVKCMREDGRVESCYIHDLLRELSIEKSKEEISFEIVMEEGDSQSQNKSRHRIIHCSGERFMIYSKNQNKHVRSLFFHVARNIAIIPSYWKSFELLRTLDFEDLILRILPDSIGTLIGLRYLGLRNCWIDKLPSSLGCLVNLEVLDIQNNNFAKVLNVLWKRINLRQLYMSSIECDEPLKIDTLKNLRTLTYISMDNITVEHLPQLNSLCELSIMLIRDSDVRKLCGLLATLDNLASLILLHRPNSMEPSSLSSLDGLDLLNRVTQLELGGKLITLPNASNFPPNLSYLTLIDTRLQEDPMPVLEKLPKLLYLKFDINAYLGKEMVISHDGFPRLKFLSLCNLWRLRNVKVIGKGAMPELQQLKVEGCRYLGSNFMKTLIKSIH